MKFFVYFAERDGLIKIGFSGSPYYRVRGLRAKMLGLMHGGRKTEKHVHQMFVDQAVGGEWFKDCEEIRNYISLNTKIGAPRKRRGKETVAIRLPSELYFQFLGMAIQEKRSISNLANVLIMEAIALRKKAA